MYAGSVVSSVYSQRFNLRKHLEAAGEGRAVDELDPSARSSLENAIFSVLFTLSKENSETRILVRWALLKILLDGWQVFTTVIQPEQGWDINANGPAWRIVNVLSFDWLADLGYGAYVALLYGMVALLGANIGLCVWVAWCFKEQKFPVLWPIKVLRLFSSVFFQSFDVACLNLLQVGMTCNLSGPAAPHLHVSLFPSHSCTSMPQLVHAIVSAASLLLFVALALLTNMAEVEVNPKSRRPMALGHSGAEVAAFAIKVLMTFVDLFLGWRRPAAVAYLALSLLMAYQYLRWSPHLVAWANHLKCGVSVAVVWASAALVILVFRPASVDEAQWRRSMTVAMLSCLAPAMGAGALASWLVSRRRTAAADRAMKKAAASNAPLHEFCAYLLADPRDVEIAARCCRVWSDHKSLDKDAVARAQTFIKAGLAIFPGNAFVSLVQANFMIDVLGVGQSGSRQVEAARKLHPGIVSRFIIFVRQQQAQQKAAGSNVDGAAGSNMDLLGYVEYQRKQRMVVRLHREALQAMCAFWKALDTTGAVSFTSLSKALTSIENSVSQAQTAYHTVLETYGNNPRLVRLYGRFLETIKNDPWGAGEYYAEAERLEQAKSDDSNGPLLPDGTPLSRMDEISTAVLVISSYGEIQMANKQVHHLFGYRKGDLDGKAMAALLAHQSSRRLAAVLAGLVEGSLAAAGQAAPAAGQQPLRPGALGEGLDAAGPGASPSTSATATVLGMHRERMAFPLRLLINKASGVGEDSTFIAMLEPLHPPRDTATFWVAPNGVVIACDPQFVAHFGFAASDMVGAHLGHFLVCSGKQARHDKAESITDVSNGLWDPEENRRGSGAGAPALGAELDNMLDRLLAQQAATGSGDKGSVPCLVSHRYTGPIPCIAAARALDLGDGASSLYELRFRPAAREPLLLLAADRKGAIRFASPGLAALLCPRARGGFDSQPGNGFAAQQVPAEGALDANAGPQEGLPAGLGGASHALLTAYSLQDFLPPPWKDMHVKLLKSPTGAIASDALLARGMYSCTRPSGPGPTLELRAASGQPLYMHVSVGSSEAVGEPLHVVRLASSSLETALSERRLRLAVSQEGRVVGVSKGTPCAQLFGFDAGQLVGRFLSEVVDDGMQEQPTAPPKPSTAASGRSGLRRSSTLKDAVTPLGSLLERALRASPGSSWRVLVKPPVRSPSGNAPSQGSAEIGVTGLSGLKRGARSRAAIMTMTLIEDSAIWGTEERPSEPGDGSSTAGAALFVDLWPLASVSGVLQLSAEGRIRGVLEERLRPAGLLFGLPTPELAGQMLEALVPLPPGRAELGDLLVAAGRDKKSSLKQDKKDGDVKVGPVHVLAGLHADGRPLAVELQLVGRPGPDHQLTALLRLHAPPMAPGGSPSASARPTPQMSAASRPAAASYMAVRPSAFVAAPRFASAPVIGTESISRPATGAVHDKPVILTLERNALQAGSGRVPSPAVPKPGTPHIFTPDLTPNESSAGPASGNPASRQGGPQLTSPAPPPIPDILVSATDLLLPGVVVGQDQGSRPDGSMKRGSTVGDTAPTPAAGLACAISLTPTFEPPRQPAALDAAMDLPATKPSSGAAGGTDAQSEEDPDAVQALSQQSLQRITEWVETKGAVYQNCTPRISACGDGASDIDELPFGFEPHGTPLEPRVGHALTGRAPAAAVWAQNGSAVNPRASGIDSGIRTASAINIAVSTYASPMPVPMTKQVQAPLPGNGSDFNDAASEGGRSAMSGASGTSSSGGAEYKRGKRFRNLVKLMDSSQAEHVLQRFRRGALLGMALLAITHTVCFALVVMSIKGQQHSMSQLVIAGRSQRMLHQALVATRALDQLYKGKAPPNLYTTADIPGLADKIYTSAAGLKELNNQVAAENRDKPTIQDLYYYTAMRVWSSKNVTNGSDVYANITLWDMATRVFTSSKDIYQNHQSWAAQGVNISSTPSGQFLLKSGSDFFNGYRRVLDALLYIAMDNTKQVNNLQLAFLAAEGCGMSVLVAALLAYLLRRLAAQRHTLYGTFLAIPVGLTRAIATQLTNTPLLDEVEEDDEDPADETEGVAKHTPRDVVSGSGDGSAPKDKEKDKGKRHATVDPSQPTHTAPHSAPSRTTSARIRRGTSGQVDASWGSRHHPLSGLQSLLRRLLSRLCCCMHIRSQAIAPWTDAADGGNSAASLPFASAGSGSLNGSATRRHLRFDSYDTAKLLTPFLLWSCAVVAFYAVSVVQLQDVQPLVAVASVSNFNTARTYRSCFFAQELAAEEDPAMIPTRRANLKRAATLLRDAFYTLQLGHNAWKALGNDTERFPMVTVGLSYETRAIQELMYSNTGCLRLPTSPPCPGTNYRYYQVIRAGQDSIMNMYLQNVFAMADEVTGVTPGLANSRFDFIYNVGTVDLTDANIQIGLLHFAYLRGLFNHILLLHIILFVLLWVCLATFVWLLLNPLVARFTREKRRIAELMSQLPLELDVEKLVRAALAGGGGGAGGAGGVGGGAGGRNKDGGTDAVPSATGTGTGMAQDGAPRSDAVKAWKNVLRAASSVVAASKEHTRRSSALALPN